MCLTKTTEIKKATENIVCYKIMRCDKNDKLYSMYFYNTKWRLNKTRTNTSRESSITVNEITGGYFHSYKNVYTAQDFLYKYKNYPHSSLALVECVIPKGTTYCEGFDSSYNLGYASKRLKVTRIIYKNLI